MPSYLIHIAIAKQYLKNHKEKKYDEKEFIEGSIAPDLVEDKSISHYGEISSKSDVNAFIKAHPEETSFNLGYRLHLISDVKFYNELIGDRWAFEIYNDYDRINKSLIEKYDIKVPKKIEKYVKFKEGKPIVFTEKEIYKFIEEMGKIHLTT